MKPLCVSGHFGYALLEELEIDGPAVALTIGWVVEIIIEGSSFSEFFSVA